jgi:hypothetical protein
MFSIPSLLREDEVLSDNPTIKSPKTIIYIPSSFDHSIHGDVGDETRIGLPLCFLFSVMLAGSGYELFVPPSDK